MSATPHPQQDALAVTCHPIDGETLSINEPCQGNLPDGTVWAKLNDNYVRKLVVENRRVLVTDDGQQLKWPTRSGSAKSKTTVAVQGDAVAVEERIVAVKKDLMVDEEDSNAGDDVANKDEAVTIKKDVVPGAANPTATPKPILKASNLLLMPEKNAILSPMHRSFLKRINKLNPRKAPIDVLKDYMRDGPIKDTSKFFDKPPSSFTTSTPTSFPETDAELIELVNERFQWSSRYYDQWRAYPPAKSHELRVAHNLAVAAMLYANEHRARVWSRRKGVSH